MAHKEHTQAAEYHESAAKSHRNAAEEHEKGSHDEGHCQGISLLARGAARRPHADGTFIALVFNNGGIDLGLQGLKSLEIAEKAGHRDEHVVVKLWSLFGMLF